MVLTGDAVRLRGGYGNKTAAIHFFPWANQEQWVCGEGLDINNYENQLAG